MTELPGLNRYLLEARSIADAWLIYKSHVMSRAASKVQQRETRMAFYAAADWIFRRMMHASSGEEDAAMELMSEINAELDAWAKRAAEDIDARR